MLYWVCKRLSALWLHPDLTLLTQWTAWQFGKFSIYLFISTLHPSQPNSTLCILVTDIMNYIKQPFGCVQPEGEVKVREKISLGIFSSVVLLIICNVWVDIFLWHFLGYTSVLELLLSSGNSFLYQTTEATLSPLYGTIHWGSSQTHWTSSVTDGTIIFHQRNRYIRDAFTAFNDFASKTLCVFIQCLPPPSLWHPI